MLPKPDFSSKRSELVLVGLSIFILSLCLYYAFLGLQIPKRNLPWDTADWEVYRNQQDCADPVRCLRQGDRILEIDDVSREAFASDPSLAILERPGVAEMLVERDGRILRIDFEWGQSTPIRTLDSMIAAMFPLLFWLMGTLASILVHPRDRRWLVLVLFYYVSSILFSCGFISFTQQAYSFYVTHISAILFLPLTVHLHLLLPNRAYPWLGRVLPPALYGLSAILLVWDLAIEPLSSEVLAALPLSALLAALTLFFGRLFMQQPLKIRMANRLMATGFLLGSSPLILILVVVPLGVLRNLPYGTDNLLVMGLVALMLPNWPLSYLYAIYKLDLGRLELRANRALGTYGFWSLYLTLYITLFLVAAEAWPLLGEQPILASLVVSLTFVATTPYLRQVFHRFVDRYVFGIHYSPKEMVSLFAARIPVAFDPEILRETLLDDILPTLMIRQSSLVFFHQDDRLADTPQCETLYLQGVEEAAPERREQVLEALDRFPDPLRPDQVPQDPIPGLEWVRFAIPLRSRGEVLGAWLLGRRDPDDGYPRDDIRMLVNLANQVASIFRTQLELEENRRLQDQLIQSQKMEAIGRLSAGVAHDFNNLLSAILGYSDLLLDQGNSRDPMAPQYVQGIKEAGEKAAALTTQLLAFSRQQVMAARVVNLDEVVGHLEGLLRRVIEEDIALRTELAGELPNVRIDPGQMEQVLLNLVVNASDAMPDGGALTLATSAVVCSGMPPHPPEVPPGEYVLLQVTDTGSGIEEAVLDRIFEPFFTTKRLGEGTGLGLAMVYGIITQSQGYITVESEPGRGTTFNIYLPAVEEQVTTQIEAVVEETQHETTEPETVLLVEDEKSVRKVVFEILRSRGYEVIEAVDGADGLEVGLRHEGPIHILLTDVMMPNMKGPELAARLTEKRPDLAVIFMSGYNEDSVLGDRLRDGRATLIRKPFTPQQLARELRNAVDDRASEPAAPETPSPPPGIEAPRLGPPIEAPEELEN